LSDIYYTALTITVLLGFFMILAGLWRYQDDIAQVIRDLASWASDNVLPILAFFFLISLAVTGLAGIGVI
jgi:hypothetical protein